VLTKTPTVIQIADDVHLRYDWVTHNPVE
jgi:hypothetical protein